MIFAQLNEKMRAMDRSLLEKIAADIEMMDKEQGIVKNSISHIFYCIMFFLPYSMLLYVIIMRIIFLFFIV